MNNCIRCNGVGHLSIMHDNDLTCPECGGTGNAPEQPVTAVATEAPLSEEAQLRIDLNEVDQLNSKRYTDEWMKTQQEWSHKSQRISTIHNLHMLLDLLDASRAETAALREQVATLTAELSRTRETLMDIRALTQNSKIERLIETALNPVEDQS